MGCISSKILTRSGSLQEKANQGFQRSSLIEEIILSSSSSKSNGDQFLAHLRTSSSAARRSKRKADAAADHSPAPAARIETIHVSDLLAGLEEEEEDERQGDRKEGEKASRLCVSDGAAGRARSFRTLEEFDAMVTRCSSPERTEPATVLTAPETDVWLLPPPPPDSISSSSEQDAVGTASSSPEPATVLFAPEPDAPQSGSSEQDAVATEKSAPPGQGEAGRGAKRRARARQLGELSAPAPAGFDFGKSGSLKDWLLGGGQIFSPGSYATPKFGKAAAAEPEEHGRERRAVFDPELVAQLEEAMEELTVDEERVLREVLEVLEAGETAARSVGERLDDPEE